jgi:hypothetical protein
MTKEFQQELKETQSVVGDQKVKEGIKPPDLKKLKRSKSADDIANSPTDPPVQLLQEQLKEKQKEIEALREKLEEKNIIPITPPPTLNEFSELDNSLISRHQNLKD